MSVQCPLTVTICGLSFTFVGWWCLPVAELSEAFNMFCNTSDKMLELCELGRVLRSAGKAPSESQLQDLTSECEKKGNCLLYI